MFLSRWSDLFHKVGEFRLFEILKKRQFRQIQIRISRQPANFYRPSIWRWKALNLYYLHLQGYLLNPNTLLKICDQSRILSLATHSDIYILAVQDSHTQWLCEARMNTLIMIFQICLFCWKAMI